MSDTIVLTCPDCGTRFSAPLAQFMPKGRQVRCSHCQHIWFHAAPDPREATAPPRTMHSAPVRPDTHSAGTATAATAATAGVLLAKAEDIEEAQRQSNAEKRRAAAEAERDAAAIPRRKRRGFLSWLLWLIALALLAAILVYVFRDPLRSAVPQAAPAIDRYTNTVDRTAQGLIGQTEAPAPMEWNNVHYDVKERDGGQEVLIEADLLNAGDTDRPAPQVRVQLVDGNREVLHTMVVGPEDMSETIAAGTSIRYFARIPEPPSNFATVLLNIEGE